MPSKRGWLALLTTRHFSKDYDAALADLKEAITLMTEYALVNPAIRAFLDRVGKQ